MLPTHSTVSAAFVSHLTRPGRRRAAIATLAVGLVVALAGPAFATGAGTTAANELTAFKAVILGLVEGITEYLPISSTGHLHVTQQILGIGTTPATKEAADTYAITIQLGAILAVLLLSWGRIVEVVQGLFGRSEPGRRLLLALVIAFAPAAITGVLFDDAIKQHLLAVGPIVAAWVVGAAAIFLLAPRLTGAGGAPLDLIAPRQALVIGVAQILALWPGTSRSLVTILAALAAGLTLGAAVEFSFLLGLVTLSAATLFDGATHGGDLVQTYGILNPLIGLVVAFASAVVAVRWMVGYLQSHDLRIFGWYRIAVAVVALLLVATNVI